jgi:hypothetical protein
MADLREWSHTPHAQLGYSERQREVQELLAERDRLWVALEALLDHAERIQEHVPKSEYWYAVRDTARAALAVSPDKAGGDG